MLANIDTMVFDKTGTLTSGAPTVADVFLTPNNLSRTDFARTLLAVESRSEHPIGHAVVEYAESILKKGMGRRTQWIVNSNFIRPHVSFHSSLRAAGGFSRDERFAITNFHVIAGRGLGCVLDGEEGV
jgi:high-affinity K+ transport system ATPase subunit B